MDSYKLQWGMTSSQVVWLLGLLNCSNCTKIIHEFGNKAVGLIDLLARNEDILRASFRIAESA
eukprot:881618-Pelagomonas_calceolata.AAC.1